MISKPGVFLLLSTSKLQLPTFIYEFKLKKLGIKPSKKHATIPFASGYRPKLDLSEELDDELCSFY